MVSERRLVKRPTSNQALIELNGKSPPISSISSIASFREKKFKKKHVTKNTGFSNYASDKASCDVPEKCNTQMSLVPRRVHQPTMEQKRLSRRKQGVLYAKKGRSRGARTILNPVFNQNNHHSSRTFSLFTLQEYLHERSHEVDHSGAPAAYDTYANGPEECEVYMESSHVLQSLDKSTDATPLLPSQVQSSYTRKPRRNVSNRCVSNCKCNRVNCRHEDRSPKYSSGQEDGDDDDEKNEAFRVEGRHGCVPWHGLSSLTPKCNKKQIIMELAGKSFACAGFPVSKRRHNRTLHTCSTSRIAPIARPCATNRSEEAQWDSLSSNFESESVPLLSESDVYDGFPHGRCYPSCNSLRPVMRRKLRLSNDEDMDINLQSKLRCHNQSRNVNSNGYGGVRRRKSQVNTTTSRRKGANSRSRNTAQEDNINRHSYQSVEGSERIQVSYMGSTAEGRQKHQSLSQKYRPRTFKEMVGQCMVTQALSNAVSKEKIAPVYLFQGPRGTGKSSAARIFAASINCLAKPMRSMRPCGVCRHCERDSLGKSSYVREVDASGNNCIEDMKSLLRFISTDSQSSKYKALIIDECHLLTRDAWNLFLNVLEAPLTHVVFVLITTDTEQLPRMVLSKCQKFAFTKIKDADICLRLRRICDMEEICAELDALQLIASRSEGSLYDAETTLDQLASLGQRITSGVVREMVGLVADEKLEVLLERAMSGDSVNTVRSTRELIETGIEPLALMSQLATLITDLLAGNPHTSAATSRPFTSQPLGKVELEKLRQALRILSEAEKQLRSCSNKATWLTAALLQFSPPDALLQHPQNHEAAQVQSSSLGTSLTQSPIALLDTSEKETADTFCNVTVDTANVKPPWDRSQHWQDDRGVKGQGEQHILYTSSMESPKVIDAKKHVNLDGNCSDIDLADDVVVSNYGTYYLQPSPHREDTRMSCESCVQEPSTIAGHSCIEYPSCNKNSSQVTPSSMDDIWRKVLEGSVLREILSEQGRLLSLSVSEAFAIAHLEFRCVEDKKRAEKAKLSISKAFEMALGCPVEVKLSLATSQGDVKGDLKYNGGGALENTQINHKKYRRRKPKTRSNRACCNQGSMSSKYYSKHQTCSNSSISQRFLGDYPFINGHHISKVSSSDESFSNWTHISKSEMSPSSYTYGLQKASMGIRGFLKVKTNGRADHTMNELDYEREVGFASSSSHVRAYVEGEGDEEIVDDNGQDILYNSSLRVERDSPVYGSQSFYENDLESDRNTMTPAFRTGFLCWKGSAKENIHEAKVSHHRARRKQKVGPVLGCVPCAHAN